MPTAADPVAALFAEELGLLLEVAPQQEEAVMKAYADAGVPVTAIGSVAADDAVSIAVGGQQQISGAQTRETGVARCRRGVGGIANLLHEHSGSMPARIDAIDSIELAHQARLCVHQAQLSHPVAHVGQRTGSRCSRLKQQRDLH